MSGTGLKTYIKNVDCCLDNNYNMNFVLENPSDVREITWTLDLILLGMVVDGYINLTKKVL